MIKEWENLLISAAVLIAVVVGGYYLYTRSRQQQATARSIDLNNEYFQEQQQAAELSQFAQSFGGSAVSSAGAPGEIIDTGFDSQHAAGSLMAQDTGPMTINAATASPGLSYGVTSNLGGT